MNLDGLRAAISERFTVILPGILLLLVALVDVMFLVTSILPAWREHEELLKQVTDGQVALSQAMAQQLEDDSTTVLQGQIDRAQTELNEAAAIFLTSSQGDGILDRLYGYARESMVEVTDLQAQQPSQSAESDAYHMQVFRLQVEGPVPWLMNFVMRFREASVPGMMITGLNITERDRQGVLILDMNIYASPYASGNALTDLPERVVPTPFPPTSTPTPAVLPTLTITPTPQPAGASLQTPPALAIVTDALLAENACPGAPPSLFTAGDSAVVDFNGSGALRILTRAGGGVYDTLAQVYDNQQLLLLEGPVCEGLQEGNIWYWYVERGGIRGWAAEASAEHRWLCPLSNPECA